MFENAEHVPGASNKCSGKPLDLENDNLLFNDDSNTSTAVCAMSLEALDALESERQSPSTENDEGSLPKLILE